MKNNLPSGRTLFNPLADVIAVSDSKLSTSNQNNSDNGIESTSMSHDADDQCPKCKGKMLPALAANNTPVLFCDACRVSNPVRVSNQAQV